MAFLDSTVFRWVLPVETDANSPITEELMSQSRENSETALLSTINTGLTATVTAVSTTILTIEKINLTGDPDWQVNAGTALTLQVRTGPAIGNPYVITSNTLLVDGGSATVTCTSADFLGDGVTVGTEVMVLYNISRAGHTHNGLDSVPLTLRQLAAAYPVEHSITDLFFGFMQIYGDGSLTGRKPYFRYNTGAKQLTFSLELNATGSGVAYPLELYIEIPAQTVEQGDGTLYPITTAVVSATQTMDVSDTNAMTVFNLTNANALDLTAAGLVDGVSYELDVYLQTAVSGTITLTCGDLKIYTT